MVAKSVMDVLWARPTTPRRGPKPTLSLEVIASAAIRIADIDGLPAVTMHRIAEVLGVTKMALYRYVPGKDEIVALMVDTALGEPPSTPHPGWRPRLVAWAMSLYERLSQHPWALEATVGARAIGPNEIAWMEEVASALAGTGLTGAETLDVVATLVAQARMVAQQVAAFGSDAPEQAINAALGDLVAAYEDRYPAMAAALADTAAGTDQALDFGIQRILDGVELLITRRGGAHPTTLAAG